MRKSRFHNLPSRTRLVVAVTACFAAVASTLAILITLTVRDMTTSATAIDDARALDAARAAVHAFEARLSATLLDNSVWDDGYRQITSDTAADFAASTWGKATDNNPLFDAAVVLTPQRAVLSSYKGGIEFDPLSFFGPALSEIVAAAEKSGRTPMVGFTQTPDGMAMIAAGSIQPHARETVTDGRFSTLVFAKFLSAAALAEMQETFDLDDLQIVDVPAENLLSIGLGDTKGSTFGYLQWPSRNPGAMIYERAHRYLLAAVVVLATFLIGVLVTGGLIVRMLQRSADKAHYRATHDALSGLLNRAGILAELDKAMTAGDAKLQLHLIDLDGFKNVNDSWGHAIGDQLIELVARRVGRLLPAEALFARLGGDEFAAVTDISADPRLADAIARRVAEPFAIGGRTIEVGASIGSVTWLGEVTEALELLRRADMALYAAKASGRGRAIAYTADLDQDRLEIAALEERLRHAILANEIRVAYQPLVDAKTGRLCGVEALARWVAATGPVSAEIFIPIAERSGLIDQLGLQVLQTAIARARQWRGLSLSVNVSAIQLRNPDFAADVLHVLAAERFDARRLTLEITEGVLMTDPERTRLAIQALRDIGVKFALDDFGCGYASIGALRTFGFDRMKIDRSLVNALDTTSGAEVLMATVSLARALNIPVTAEGVETQQQADVLTRSGCDQLQGFLIGKPMPAEDITKLLTSNAA